MKNDFRSLIDSLAVANIFLGIEMPSNPWPWVMTMTSAMPGQILEPLRYEAIHGRQVNCEFL